MRVVVQGDPTTRSGAEDTVAGLLRDWNGEHRFSGLCVMHVHVPTGGRTREVDGLLWTPHGLSVLEVKGFTTAQAGTLHMPANGPWRVDDEPAALHTLADMSPAEQCQTGVYAVRNTLQAAGVDSGFITGLVALVHPNRRHLAVGDTTRLPKGVSVALATHTDLRRRLHLQREHAARPCWSADDVLAACAALDLSALAPPRAELLTEGFPDVITYSDRPRQPRSRPSPPSTRRPTQHRTSPSPAATAAPSSTGPFGPLGPSRPFSDAGPPPPRRAPPAAATAPRPRPASRPTSAPPVARRTQRPSVASLLVLVLLFVGMLTVLGFVAVYL